VARRLRNPNAFNLSPRRERRKPTSFTKRGTTKHRHPNRRQHGIARPAHIAHFHTLGRQIQCPTVPFSTDHPVGTILACSDSRVPLELLFDRGFGDLFTIRMTGNVITSYGIAHGGLRRIPTFNRR
jgi:hypothetical protein